MNGHARRCRDEITALGFTVNTAITETHNNGKTYYTHHNSPAEPLSIYGKIDERTARIVVDRARKIAGLDATGAKRNSEQIRERQRQERAKRAEQAVRERVQREQRDAEASLGIAIRRAMREQADRIREHEAHDREIRALMMPGRSA